MVDVSDDQIKALYDTIRKDSSQTNWVVIGFASGTKLEVQGSGEGGVSEMATYFKDDQPMFGYLRVISGDQESKRAKFVFVSWCGGKVGALKRAKVSVQKAEVKKVFRDFAVEIHAEAVDEITEEIVMGKVRKAGGADYSGNLAAKE